MMLTDTQLQDAVWTPARLFRPGDKGGFWDFRPEHCAQNSDGTGAAAVGSPVGWVRDLSGNGNHLVQATSANKPSLAISDGFCAQMDGVDDALDTTNTIDIPTKVTMAWCVDNKSASNISFNANPSDGGQFGLDTDTPVREDVQYKIGATNWYTVHTVDNLQTRRVSIARRAQDGITIDRFINNAQYLGISAPEQTGAPAAKPRFRCDGSGGNISFCFALLIISREITDAEVELLKRWLARRAGITL